jgi:hypothetical protein
MALSIILVQKIQFEPPKLPLFVFYGNVAVKGDGGQIISE